MTIAERLRQEGIALGKQEGIALGKQEGIALGKHELLAQLIERRFGPLPEHARERLRGASNERLARWADRIFDAASLEELLAE